MVDGPYEHTPQTYATLKAQYINFGNEGKIRLNIETGEWTIDPSLELSEASLQVYRAIQHIWNTH